MKVIGTERHESRRIDNQLRGRSGRQGDPGESLFYVALDDDLMRIFGGEQISKLMTFFKFPEDQSLTHPMVSKAIEQAQVKVEGFNFDIRKHLVDFDDVLNKQRDIIYTLRRKILTLPEKDKDKFKETILGIFQEEVNVLVNAQLSVEGILTKENSEKLEKEFNLIFDLRSKELDKYVKDKNAENLVNYLNGRIEKEYREKENELGEKMWTDVARIIFLATIDKFWTEHLTAIDDLREGINLRGYAQMDPLVEYKNEAYSMFEKLLGEINFEATRRLFKIKVETRRGVSVRQKSEKDQPMQFKSAARVDPYSQAAQKQGVTSMQSNIPSGQIIPPIEDAHPHIHSDNQQPLSNNQSPTTDNQIGFRVNLPGQVKKKPGRNDPCWCGSGKKYKKCHLLSDSV